MGLAVSRPAEVCCLEGCLVGASLLFAIALIVGAVFVYAYLTTTPCGVGPLYCY